MFPSEIYFLLQGETLTMKKLLSVILALTMLLLTACGGNDGSTGDVTGDSGTVETPAVIDSIYEDITGIRGEKVLVTVDGNEIPAAMYFYWMVGNAQNLAYQLQTYAMYYGMYTDAFNADGTLKWDYELAEGYTLADQVEDQTRNTAVYYATVENMAKELGVTLTDEDRAAMAEDANSIAEQYRQQLVAQDPAAEALTAEEIMAKYLETIGIDSAIQERISAAYFLFQHLKDVVLTEGSGLYLEDEDCNEYGYFADHILISTVDTETREPLSEEKVLEKTSLAREILTRLEDSGWSVDLFKNLADEYSEDPGRQSNPEGYLFTPGTMVEEFETATEGLDYGEISGIVQSDYGYHIILRKNIAEGLALYPDQKAMFAEEHLNALVNLEMLDSEAVYDDALTSFDAAKFYEDYMALVNETSGQSETVTE